MPQVLLNEAQAIEIYQSLISVSLHDGEGSRAEEVEEVMAPFFQPEYLHGVLHAIEGDLESYCQHNSAKLDQPLTALGFLLSGLWIRDQMAANPLDSARTHSNLLPLLLQTIQAADELRIKLLALFVISNQCVPTLVLPHVPSLVEEISGLLSSAVSSTPQQHATGDDTSSIVFFQCISALLTLNAQHADSFSQHCGLVLMERLFAFLINSLMELSNEEVAIEDDKIDLIRDICVIVLASRPDVCLILQPTATNNWPALNNAIKNLASSGRNAHCLDLCGTVWQVWLHIVAAAALEKKALFFDLIAPPNSVGQLVAPLQRLLGQSRGRAARCYYQLSVVLVRDQNWFSPNSVLKLLLRCFQHLLFVLPPSLAKKFESCDTNWTESELQSAQDAAQGIHYAGKALACLLRNIPWNQRDAVYGVSVSSGSQGRSQAATTKICIVSILSTLHKACEQMSSSMVEDCVPESPRKRARVQNDDISVMEVIDCQRLASFACCLSSQLAADLVGWKIEHCTFNQLGPQPEELTVPWDNMNGLFSCKVGFRRSDIVQCNLDGIQPAGVGAYPDHIRTVIELLRACRHFHGYRSSQNKTTITECITSIVQFIIGHLCEVWQSYVLVAVKMSLFSRSADQRTKLHNAERNGSDNIASQLFSQIGFSLNSSSVYHYTQLNGQVHAMDSELEEQVVLCAENSRATDIARIVFRAHVQLTEMLVELPRCDSLMCLHVLATESLWWILHRTSAFQLSLDHARNVEGEPVNTNDTTIDVATSDNSTQRSATARLMTLCRRMKMSSIELPDDTMVRCLVVMTLINGQLSERLCSSAVSSCAGSSLLWPSMANTVNALTESGALPQVICTLHSYVIHSFPKSNESGLRSNVLQLVRGPSTGTIPRVLCTLVQLVLVKLAEMAAPSLSEQLSAEVLDGLLSGLRSLLVLPLCILNLRDDRSVFDEGRRPNACADPQLTDYEQFIGNNLVISAFKHLLGILKILETLKLQQEDLPMSDNGCIASSQCALQCVFITSINCSGRTITSERMLSWLSIAHALQAVIGGLDWGSTAPFLKVSMLGQFLRLLLEIFSSNMVMSNWHLKALIHCIVGCVESVSDTPCIEVIITQQDGTSNQLQWLPCVLALLLLLTNRMPDLMDNGVRAIMLKLANVAAVQDSDFTQICQNLVGTHSMETERIVQNKLTSLKRDHPALIELEVIAELKVDPAACDTQPPADMHLTTTKDGVNAASANIINGNLSPAAELVNLGGLHPGTAFVYTAETHGERRDEHCSNSTVTPIRPAPCLSRDHTPIASASLMDIVEVDTTTAATLNDDESSATLTGLVSAFEAYRRAPDNERVDKLIASLLLCQQLSLQLSYQLQRTQQTTPINGTDDKDQDKRIEKLP